MIRFMRRVKIATLRSSKRLVTRFIMQLKAKSLRPIASISRCKVWGEDSLYAQQQVAVSWCYFCSYETGRFR